MEAIGDLLRLRHPECRAFRIKATLRHSREITRVCSRKVTHHCTTMVQVARGQDRFWFPGNSRQYLKHFHHPR
jgi:hypothetical protein